MGEKRDCTHKRACHEHGTRLAYLLDKCRCDPCTKASTDYHRDLRRRQIYAEWRPELAALVDAEPARKHIQWLRSQGMGPRTIAKAAGLSSDSMITDIIHGEYPHQPNHREHRLPRKRIHRELEAKILAVKVELAPGARVERCGTVRRLQALVAIGWTITALAGMIGTSVSNLGPLVAGKRGVLKSTADRVCDIYDQLWDSPPPETVQAQRARKMAADRRWLPPLAWDDDMGPHGIDNPKARPATGKKGRQRALAELDEIEEMLASGRSAEGIAESFGVTPGAIANRLVRAGRDRTSARKFYAAEWRQRNQAS